MRILIDWPRKDVIDGFVAGSNGQAIAERVGAEKHVLLADLRPENAEAAAKVSGYGGLVVSTHLETNAMSGRMSEKHIDKAGKAKPKSTGASAGRAIRARNGELAPAAESTLGNWREKTVARMRALILKADPEMIEERKWKKPSNAMAGVPVWSHNGIVCTGETYKSIVKLTFAKGASLPDPSRLFNSSLEGNTRRAIDIHEGETVDAGAFKTLVKAAVAANGPPSEANGAGNRSKGTPRTISHKDGSLYAKGQMLDGKMHGYWEFFRKDGTIMRSGSFDCERQIGTWTTYDAGGRTVRVTEMKAGSPARAKSDAKETMPRASKAKPAKLLSGGNPQIAKGDGDAPVRAYIAAMSGGGPGWKRDLGKRLDAMIVRTVPGVRKAVKWNSPFYGLDGQGWFLSFHVFARYVKVAFFRGTSLRPLPPGGTPKSGETRYLDIHEGEPFDEAQMADWVRQAAALPGWVP